MLTVKTFTGIASNSPRIVMTFHVNLNYENGKADTLSYKSFIDNSKTSFILLLFILRRHGQLFGSWEIRGIVNAIVRSLRLVPVGD